MKFAIYENHTITRRLFTEANSKEEAIHNWRTGDCELDQEYYFDGDDYELDEIEEIDEIED